MEKAQRRRQTHRVRLASRHRSGTFCCVHCLYWLERTRLHCQSLQAQKGGSRVQLNESGSPRMHIQREGGASSQKVHGLEFNMHSDTSPQQKCAARPGGKCLYLPSIINWNRCFLIPIFVALPCSLELTVIRTFWTM